MSFGPDITLSYIQNPETEFDARWNALIDYVRTLRLVSVTGARSISYGLDGTKVALDEPRALPRILPLDLGTPDFPPDPTVIRDAIIATYNGTMNASFGLAPAKPPVSGDVLVATQIMYRIYHASQRAMGPLVIGNNIWVIEFQVDVGLSTAQQSWLAIAEGFNRLW